MGFSCEIYYNSPLLLALILTCDSRGTPQPTPEDRTFELFQQYMQGKDRQMAEVIAYGTLGKFGAEHPLIQKMRHEVVKSAEGNRSIVKRFDISPAPSAPPKYDYKLLNKVYSVADLLKPENNTYSKPLKKLAVELLKLRDNVAKEAIAACPFDSNISIVVSTTKEHHERITEYLKMKRETR